MKYFVDEDTHWDIDGYWEQFDTLAPRLGARTFALLSKTSFHDADVYSIEVENQRVTGRRRRKDPTAVTITLRHAEDGRVYVLRYAGVNAVEFTFASETHPLTWGEFRGLDDWLYDELTPHSDEYLAHEVEFRSGARLRLVFRRLECTRPRPVRRPTVVCLCGSTRFREAFAEANRRETLAGKVVLSIASYTQSDVDLLAGLSERERAAVLKRLADLHAHKIAMADEVLVINVGGYVGESTRREIEQARTLGRPVRFWE